MANASASEFTAVESAGGPPAPLSGWRRLAADVAAVGGSTLVCQALGVVTSLLLRTALSPAQMGVWQGLKLLLGYANYANLGVSKGAARELAIAAGSGQLARAERGLNLAFTVNTLTSLTYGGCLASAAVWLGRHDGVLDHAWSVGLFIMAAMVVLQRHLTFHVTILRCRQAFALTSWVALVEGLLTLTLAGLGAWRWGLAGLYGGTLLTMAGTLLFLRCQGVRSFRCDWQWPEIKRLVAIGGPILLCGLVLTLFQSLDKLMLLSFSSQREYDLGCYSTTLLITGQIFGLANMIAMVVSPRYAELFGRTASRREVARLAARASELVSAATSLAAVVGLVVAVPILGKLFPDYRPGLLPAVWLVPGVTMLAITLPLNQYLVAICRERAALVASVVALLAAAVGNYAALKLGYGMAGVAASTAIVYGAYYLLMLFLSIWPDLDGPTCYRYVLTHAALLAFPLAPAVWLTDPAQVRFDPFHVMFSSLAVLTVWGVAVLVVWRRGEWSVAWRAALSPCPAPRRPSLAELEARCQKPDYRRSGNWMARRVSRPMALRITWVVAPTGVSAHAVTCAAILVALASAGSFASGQLAGWLVGAGLLQLWYLLDHVDGQIARLRGTSSLDGIQLDYLMHHLVNLVVPYSLGFGLWKETAGEHWLLFGFAFSVGLLLLGLANDTRYKAFVARLKQLDGIPLAVCHGAGASSVADATEGVVYKRLLRLCVHLARKLCEIHVVMNVVTAIAAIQCFANTTQPMQLYLAVLAPLALLTAVATLARDIRRGAAEREFARWYRTGVEDGVSPDERAQQRTKPEVVSAGDFIAAGDS